MTAQTKQVSFRLPPHLKAGMDTIRERWGIPLSEQIRRALEVWINEELSVPPMSAAAMARAAQATKAWDAALQAHPGPRRAPRKRTR